MNDDDIGTIISLEHRYHTPPRVLPDPHQRSDWRELLLLGAVGVATAAWMWLAMYGLIRLVGG